MRLTATTALIGVCFSQAVALAQDRPPDPGVAAAPQTLIGQVSAMLPARLDVGGDRLILIGAGAVFAVVMVNFMSGGMVAALVNNGGANVSAASIATFALSEMSWHGTVWGIGPATVLSVGQPVDAALRDGFTTPSTLAAAFAESGRRAEALVVGAGSYVGETVGGLWKRL
jgi:hypothetical protein